VVRRFLFDAEQVLWGCGPRTAKNLTATIHHLSDSSQLSHAKSEETSQAIKIISRKCELRIHLNNCNPPTALDHIAGREEAQRAASIGKSKKTLTLFCLVEKNLSDKQTTIVSLTNSVFERTKHPDEKATQSHNQSISYPRRILSASAFGRRRHSICFSATQQHQAKREPVKNDVERSCVARGNALRHCSGSWFRGCIAVSICH
jgi:hypothetical protein